MNNPQPSPGGAPTAAGTFPSTQNNQYDDDRQQEDGTALSTFSQYQPSALPLHITDAYGKDSSSAFSSHTSPACESNLLSSVPAPALQDSFALATNLLPLIQQQQARPALSPLQLEGVLLALQRHRRIFRNGERAGFFIGDGAGVGKASTRMVHSSLK